MRQLSALIAVLALTGSAAAAQRAQQLTDSEGLSIRISREITARFDKANVREVLQALGEHAGIDVRFEEGLEIDRTTNIRFEKANVADAFTLVLRGAELGFRVIDDKTLLIVKSVQK